MLVWYVELMPKVCPHHSVTPCTSIDMYVNNSLRIEIDDDSSGRIALVGIAMSTFLRKLPLDSSTVKCFFSIKFSILA
jgi:hypothetical protein